MGKKANCPFPNSKLEKVKFFQHARTWFLHQIRDWGGAQYASPLVLIGLKQTI